jgi:hypothetical protein
VGVGSAKYSPNAGKMVFLQRDRVGCSFIILYIYVLIKANFPTKHHDGMITTQTANFLFVKYLQNSMYRVIHNSLTDFTMVWEEMDYRLEVFCVIKSGNIEYF